MINIKSFIIKTKKAFREFKKGERGGEIVNQILMLVVALLLIALILWFALVQFEKCKDKVQELFGIELDSSQTDKIEIKNFDFYSNYNYKNDDKNISVGEGFTLNFQSIAKVPEFYNNFIDCFEKFLSNN